MLPIPNEYRPLGDGLEIPNKLYFRIGEVAELTGIKPYVIRFWETEFSGLGPKKSGTGHRLYRRKDVELVLEIKQLLYQERFTIEGARRFLQSKPGKNMGMQTASILGNQAENRVDFFGQIRRELVEILDLLGS